MMEADEAAQRAVASTRANAPVAEPKPTRGRLRRDVAWIFVFSLAANLLLLSAPLHMMTVYDRVLASGSGATLFWITAIAVAALVLFGLAEVVRTLIAQRASAAYVADTSAPLFRALVHEETVDRASVLRDFYLVRQIMASRAMLALFDLPFAPVFLLFLFVLHVEIGLLTLAGLLALCGIAWAERRWLGGSVEEATRATAEAMSISQAFVQRSQDIRAMGLFPSVLRHWGTRMGRAISHADDAAQAQSVFFGLSRTVRQALQIVVIAWGAWLVVQGDLSAGIIFAASLISGRVLQPVEQVIGAWDRLTQLRRGHARIDEFLAQVRAAEHDVVPAVTVGDLEVANVSLDVPAAGLGAALRSKPILRNVSFALPAGSILAVVGPSGAGKSTLARLLVGSVRPSEGVVRLDGLDITRWPDERRRGSVGYVSQDVTLLPGTVAQNICGFDPHPDEDRIIAAAKQAGAHDMVARLGEGYATPVGPGMQDLSGGQRQQVALAAAFYPDPRLLVLDEPNAFLDQEAEDALFRTLALAKARGQSAIVVSQRRSVLRVADHVATIVDGRLASFQPNRGQWRARRGDDRSAHRASHHHGSHEVAVSDLVVQQAGPAGGLRGSLPTEGDDEVFVSDLARRAGPPRGGPTA